MDIIDLHDKAIAHTDSIIKNIGPDRLDAPTPCTEFAVSDLLNHLSGTNMMFTQAAKGEKAEFSPSSGGDPLAGWTETSTAVQQAWQDRALLEKPAELPFGTFPGQVAMAIHFMEVLVHGWDLAKATGQDTTLPADLAQAAYDNFKPMLGPEVRQGNFGPEVACPADAPIHEKLVAFLGRDPKA